MNATFLILMSLNLEEQISNKQAWKIPIDPNNCNICSVVKRNRINAKDWFNNIH